LRLCMLSLVADVSSFHLHVQLLGSRIPVVMQVVFGSMCAFVRMCMWGKEKGREGVCVCVRERHTHTERERERERGRKREGERAPFSSSFYIAIGNG
jgi:hypothetical protein